MKKIITFLLILSLAFVGVYASEINVNRESGVIVIYGSCEPDTKVTLLMLKDGKTKEDIPLINMLTLDEYVEYIDQTVSSSGGDFSFVYGTQEKVSFQKFSVFLKEITLDSQIEELNFVYYTKESAYAMAETIIEKTSGEDIYNMMSADVFALLELDTTFYENFSEEDKILTFDEVAKLTEGDSETLKNTFWEASLLKTINYTKTPDDLTALINKAENKKIEQTVFGFSMAKNSRFASLKDYQALFKNNLLKKTEFESVSEYHDWCNTQLALTCIKCFKSTAIESVLEEFADVLEIDLSLLEKAKNKESIFVALAGKTYDTKEAFQNAYQNAASGSTPANPPVIVPVKPPVTGSVTTSGGGGGGGGGSFGGNYNSSVVIPEAETEKEELKPTFSDLDSKHYSYAAVLKLSEDNKTLTFDRFIDFDGGMTKFVIRRDEKTGKYISLVNNITNIDYAKQRTVLSLAVSDDAYNWEIKETLLYPNVLDNWENVILERAYQYVDWIIDGDDILYVVREAGDGAPNYHDALDITFYRLKNFRQYL